MVKKLKLRNDGFKLPAGTVVKAEITWEDEEGNQKTHQADIRESEITCKVGEAVMIKLDGYLTFPNLEECDIGREPQRVAGWDTSESETKPAAPQWRKS